MQKFVKIVRREIGESVRYLPDQKTNIFSAPSQTVATARIAQSLPWPAPNIWLITFQISSKSVHFRRSYSRPREAVKNAPQSRIRAFPITRRSIASRRVKNVRQT